MRLSSSLRRLIEHDLDSDLRFASPNVSDSWTYFVYSFIVALQPFVRVLRFFAGTGMETLCPGDEFNPEEWAILTRVRFDRKLRGKMRCSRCSAIAPSPSHPLVRRFHGGIKVPK